MQWTGERFIPGEGGPVIALEHMHRYHWAQSLGTNSRVLDVASGEGYGSALMSSTASAVIGIDRALEAVMHAQTRYGDCARFLCADAGALPLASSSFDVITCFE